MNEVSVFRLYVLRAMYLFIVVGLGVYLWPGVLNPQKTLGTNGGDGLLHARRLFLALHAGAALSAADAARAPMGSGLEDALAHARSVTAMDGRPCRRFDQALDLFYIHGRARLHRHSLALCICALRESARRSLAVTSTIERKYDVRSLCALRNPDRPMRCAFWRPLATKRSTEQSGSKVSKSTPPR